MKIEINTTHDIAEEVYFMFNNTIKKGLISEIEIEQTLSLHNPYTRDSDVGEVTKVRYTIKGLGHKFGTNDIFKNQDELINSIRKP